jgi:heptosyltransferase-1
MSLREAAQLLKGAEGVVGVDTGLAHLAVALGRPTVGLYITTEPRLTGLYGDAHAVNLGGGTEDSPSIPGADLVWDTLLPHLGRRAG